MYNCSSENTVLRKLLETFCCRCPLLSLQCSELPVASPWVEGVVRRVAERMSSCKEYPKRDQTFQVSSHMHCFEDIERRPLHRLDYISPVDRDHPISFALESAVILLALQWNPQNPCRADSTESESMPKRSNAPQKFTRQRMPFRTGSINCQSFRKKPLEEEMV